MPKLIKKSYFHLGSILDSDSRAADAAREQEEEDAADRRRSAAVRRKKEHDAMLRAQGNMINAVYCISHNLKIQTAYLINNFLYNVI